MRAHNLLLAFLPVALAASDTSLRILHRVWHPSLTSEPFLERGTVLLTGSGPVPQASLVPAQGLETQLLAFAEASQNIEYDKDLVLYQLALEHPGDTQSSQWHVSAVKAVRIPSTPSYPMHPLVTQPFYHKFLV